MQQSYEPSVGSAGNARASITKKTRKTRIATSEQIDTLECASKRVPAADLDAIRKTLNDDGRQQLDDAITATFHPERVCDITPDPNSVPVSHGVPVSAFQRLVDDNVIERVSAAQQQQSPTKGGGRAFFVLETRARESGELFERTRFIFWQRTLNAALKSPSSSYRVKVRMEYVKKYIRAIVEEAAATGDIASGFNHVVIPEFARPWFRIIDQANNLYQMRLLPQGVVTSVQIMEVITLALIGSPLVCNSTSVIRGVNLSGYVDDFRIAGTPRRVQHAIDIIEQRAATFNVQLKSRLSVSTKVTFLGIDFDHNSKTISISKKTLSKLPSRFNESICAGDLHRAVARLIYCSAPLNINIGRFFFTMKHVTKFCNKINNGLIDDDTIVSLPNALRVSLQRWRDLVHEPVDLTNFDWTSAQRAPRCTLFTDASLHGWGAFLITSDGAVFIVGGAWRDAHLLSSRQINWLEARAVRYAFQSFRGIIMHHRSVDLRIDNTSVVSAMQRGRARAAAVHIEVVEPIEWLSSNGITVRTSYVESSNNPADPVSRGIFPTGVAAS